MPPSLNQFVAVVLCFLLLSIKNNLTSSSNIGLLSKRDNDFFDLVTYMKLVLTIRDFRRKVGPVEVLRGDGLDIILGKELVVVGDNVSTKCQPELGVTAAEEMLSATTDVVGFLAKCGSPTLGQPELSMMQRSSRVKNLSLVLMA